MSIEDDPGHAAYVAALANAASRGEIRGDASIPVPAPSLSSPEAAPGHQQAVQSADPGADSPLSLQESHARLTVMATKLGESVRAAKVQSDQALILYRQLRDELDETERALRAMDRIRTPRKRKP